ncbi:MAG: Nif3-like dinuclear metal center hexameric protein [Phycisphaerales bacterium]
MSIPLNDLIRSLERMAPPMYAEPWDNVGLLFGSRDMTIDCAMLTIDLTEAIAREAVESGAQLIVSYHPIMFHPVQRITDDDPQGRMLLLIANHGLAVYSPHTALDAAPNGVTDWLADAIGTGYRRALTPYEGLDRHRAFKVVTFVPAEHVERVRDALATAGAGRIGEYEQCSFQIDGTGTFRGREGTKPAIGQPDRLERVNEVRLEMVCPRATLHVLVQTLREFHPYEEPAFDLYPLQPAPDIDRGAGRKVTLDQAATVSEIADRLKAHLGIRTVKTTDLDRSVKSVGLVPGAGASLLDNAIAQDCELFITGEMTHHQALGAELRGCSVILTGHTNSERGYLPILKRRLEAQSLDLDLFISEVDRTRFQVF